MWQILAKKKQFVIQLSKVVIQKRTVLTVLIHLGYLLRATLDGDTVARMVENVHQENTSIVKYKNENSMACVLTIAYYYAHGDYIFHREFQTGKAAIKREQSQARLNSAEREQVRTESKGFADLVLIPRKNTSTPAIIVEMKYGHSPEEAIVQIKERRYQDKVAVYTGEILLVGISYDREAKTHQCRIETWNP